MNKERTLFLITVIAAFIILIIAASISVIISKEKEEMELKLNRSIYNLKPSGYAAWYKIATQSNINLKPWKSSFRTLKKIKDEKSTMLIISPELIAGREYVFTTKDIEELLNWVRIGNTLIFVDDFNRRSSQMFLSALNIKDVDKQKDEPEFDLLDEKNELYTKEKTLFDIPEKAPFDFNAETFSSTCKVRLKEKKHIIETVVGDASGLVLGKRDYGKGEIYILTLPDLVDNSTLYENEDNYQFFTNLVLAGGNDIYVNEYVHGFVKSDSPVSYYKNTLMNPISKQIILFMIVLIWSVSRRFGKVIPVKEPDRRTNAEYVEAMANLYLLAGLTGTALTPVYNQFKQVLCKNLRTDIKTQDDDLFRLIKNHYNNQQAEMLINLIVRAQSVIKSNSISKEEMLEICRELNSYRLKGIRYASRS